MESDSFYPPLISNCLITGWARAKPQRKGEEGREADRERDKRMDRASERGREGEESEREIEACLPQSSVVHNCVYSWLCLYDCILI